jgi:hypothetical protein
MQALQVGVQLAMDQYNNDESDSDYDDETSDGKDKDDDDEAVQGEADAPPADESSHQVCLLHGVV